MEGRLKILTLAVAAVLLLASCATTDSSGDSTGGENSEFSELDKSNSADSSVQGSDNNIENELDSIENDSASQGQQTAQNNAEQNTDDLSLLSNDESQAQQEKNQDQVNLVERPEEQRPPPSLDDMETIPPPEITDKQTIPPPMIEESVPMPIVEESIPVEPPPIEVANSSSLVNIKKLQYKTNDSGGTITVEGDGPMTFQTRMNEKNNQFIVEIPKTKLSKMAKRILNTKDFSGAIGSVDSYQNPGSDISRIVVQLRDGASEPVVQSEGHVLLIVAEKSSDKSTATLSSNSNNGEELASPENMETDAEPESKILSTASLSEFISGNQKFYGKKISIEANDADVRDIIKFISDESGVNLVLSEDVKGKLSVRLRDIPWDQALVIVMKAKKLGYSRQGQVLRIAQLKDLQEEEQNYQKIALDKLNAQPLTVKMIAVSYAKVEELISQVKPFLSERGKIIAETRTSAVVISDTAENIVKAEKLIRSLDIPPSQVLIEGKIVEARDSFEKKIGINWSTSGESISLGSNGKGQAMNGTFANTSFGSKTSNYGNYNLSIGAIDFLGDLSASLSLGEAEGKVKVLSSPRVLTLHNETAEVNQNSQFPILTYGVSTTGVQNTTPTVTYKDVLLKLSVTPQITNDASVIMTVDVKRDFPGPVSDNGSGARPVNNRSAKTKVIVKNGQTAVIGGIYQSDATQQENGVPGLSKIPVLGWLFKSHNETLEKNELLIFLTPRIVGQADSGVSPPGPVNIPADSELKLEDEL